MSLQSAITQLCQDAKLASEALGCASSLQKEQCIQLMGEALAKHRADILKINQAEVVQAQQKGLSTSTIDRMTLNEKRLTAMIASMVQIQKLPDPVRRVLAKWQVPSGLTISRVSMPLGVIGVIYESRPNVTVDAATLALKAGNAIILRGGSECEKTNRALVAVLQIGLKQSGLPAASIQYVPQQEREALDVLLKMENYIDVIIPRGGKGLLQKISQTTRIPLFRHLAGLCHTYIHEAADLEMATRILVNAKMRRPGICGATETLLIDRSIAARFLPKIIASLLEQHCEIRGDAFTQQIDARVKAATVEDWQAEYLDAVLSIKVVDHIKAAIDHIRRYSSQHTDAIITNDAKAAQYFFEHVLSANVLHNCSTQFADGGEFGMGAEIGIATGKLHARGPVGVEQLTTFQYWVEGNGQIRP